MFELCVGTIICREKSAFRCLNPASIHFNHKSDQPQLTCTSQYFVDSSYHLRNSGHASIISAFVSSPPLIKNDAIKSLLVNMPKHFAENYNVADSKVASNKFRTLTRRVQHSVRFVSRFGSKYSSIHRPSVWELPHPGKLPTSRQNVIENVGTVGVVEEVEPIRNTQIVYHLTNRNGATPLSSPVFTPQVPLSPQLHPNGQPGPVNETARAMDRLHSLTVEYGPPAIDSRTRGLSTTETHTRKTVQESRMTKLWPQIQYSESDESSEMQNSSLPDPLYPGEDRSRTTRQGLLSDPQVYLRDQFGSTLSAPQIKHIPYTDRIRLPKFGIGDSSTTLAVFPNSNRHGGSSTTPSTPDFGDVVGNPADELDVISGAAGFVALRPRPADHGCYRPSYQALPFGYRPQSELVRPRSDWTRNNVNTPDTPDFGVEVRGSRVSNAHAAQVTTSDSSSGEMQVSHSFGLIVSRPIRRSSPLQTAEPLVIHNENANSENVKTTPGAEKIVYNAGGKFKVPRKPVPKRHTETASSPIPWSSRSRAVPDSPEMIPPPSPIFTLPLSATVLNELETQGQHAQLRRGIRYHDTLRRSRAQANETDHQVHEFSTSSPAVYSSQRTSSSPEHPHPEPLGSNAIQMDFRTVPKTCSNSSTPLAAEKPYPPPGRPLRSLTSQTPARTLQQSDDISSNASIIQETSDPSQMATLLLNSFTSTLRNRGRAVRDVRGRVEFRRGAEARVLNRARRAITVIEEFRRGL